MAFKSIIFFIALVASSLVALPSEPQPQQDQENLDFLYPTDESSRIIGGNVAPDGSDPHMVVLTRGTLIRSLVCGGSLITQRTVLTAAHCIVPVFSFGQLISTLRGTAGTNRWNSGGVTFRFERNVTHPHYVSQILKNDIGLLITTTDVPLSDRVRVVPISVEFVTGDVPVRAAGWGSTRLGGSASQVLRELRMNTISGEDCVRDVAIVAAAINRVVPPVDPELEVCTFHSRGNGMCHGDSGSALTLQDSSRLVGVVSWGVPCAVGGPDMFTRVSAYSDWLVRNIV